MSSSLSFYGGWAGIAVVGAGYWYLQKRKPATKQTNVTATRHATKQTDARKDAKNKKNRSEGEQSNGDQTSEKKATKKPRKAVKPDSRPALKDIVPQSTNTNTNDNDDDEIDNREFARQLNSAKTGTTIGSRPQAGARQKSVKQSRAQSTTTDGFGPSENAASGASSNAGADADDDLSSTGSPILVANGSKNLGGVGDMLEPSSQGPSVLRITSPSNAQPKKENRPQKVFEQAETKKQRQNRKKREAEKATREAAESERKVLLEAQRRTAREAEGRAAKDGSLYTSAAVAASVWKAERDEKPNTVPTNGHVELLDTYEPVSRSTATKPKSELNNDYATLPSEEEQLRLIEEDSAWNTVTKPKKGKKKADDSVKLVETLVETAPEPVPIKLPKQHTIEVNWVENNKNGVAKYDLEDDEWEVA